MREGRDPWKNGFLACSHASRYALVKTAPRICFSQLLFSEVYGSEDPGTRSTATVQLP